MLSFYLSLVETEEEKSELEQLYITYRGRMLSVAMRYLHNKPDAEDAVQEAFFRIATRNTKIFQIEPNKQRAYLDVIVRNVSFDMFRKSKTAPLPLDEDIELDDMSISVEDTIVGNISCEALRDFILTLPEGARDAAYMRYFLQLTYAEISQKLNITENTLRYRLFPLERQFAVLLKKELTTMSEDIFCRALEEAYKSEFGEINNETEYEFSPRHQRRMKKLFRQYNETNSVKTKSAVRISRKLLYIAVIIVSAVLLGITSIAVATGGFKFEVKPEYTRVLSEGWEKAPATIEYLYQIDVPEGYTLIECDPDFGYSKFQRNNDYLILNQTVKRDYTATYNTEGYKLEELLLDDNKKAFFIQWEDASVLVCDNGDYILELYGPFSKEEMLALLKTARVAE